MARLSLVALCVTVATVTTTQAASPLSFGMSMGTRAYDAVCWYENLKTFPETHSKNYGQCSERAKGVQKNMENPSEQNKKYFKMYPDKEAAMYGDWMNKQAMGKIPEEYKTSCEQYLKDADAEAPADEGDALNDGGNSKYPYRAFSYCLMNTLRTKNGDKAIDAVKDERTHSLKNWMQTLLDRDNEWRARHGVPPLQLSKDLVDAAQEWSDNNANACDMHHSKNNDTFRQWRDAGTGESLSAGGGDDIKEVAAYIASDGWYEENKDYPYPDGYKGDGNDALFGKIGHFTQTVWKDTKYVGYGYTYNGDCKDQGKYTRYVAARYSPAGNMRGKYTENVLPIKE